MEFKITPIGKIPEEWEIKRVEELFEIKTGSTPSTNKKEYWSNAVINWITPSDLSKNEGIEIADSERKINEEALRKTNLNLIPENSIILSTRAPVGYVAINTIITTFNQGCKGLVPKNNKINSFFYAYYLLSKKYMLENLSGGYGII